MRFSQVHNEIGSSTVTNVLSGRSKENDFIIKSGMEIDKNVKLRSLTSKPCMLLRSLI